MYRHYFKILLIVYILIQVIAANFKSAAFADDRAFLYGGDILIVDTINDSIQKKVDLPTEIDKKRVYGLAAFPGANSLMVVNTYNVYVLDIDTMKFRKKMNIASQYEHIKLILSPDKKKLYAVWLPYTFITEYQEGKSVMNWYDENLKEHTVPEIQLDETARNIDFSADGNRLYVLHDSTPKKIQVIDMISKKTIQDVSFDSFGKKEKEVFNKIIMSMKNQDLLIAEIDRKDTRYKYTLYAYNVENHTTTKQISIEVSASLECNLLAINNRIVCDEGQLLRNKTIRRGTLHIYDVGLGKELGVVDIATAPDDQNHILGISTDEKKLYYMTTKGIKVVDLENATVVKTLDVTPNYNYMTFN